MASAVMRGIKLVETGLVNSLGGAKAALLI